MNSPPGCTNRTPWKARSETPTGRFRQKRPPGSEVNPRRAGRAAAVCACAAKVPAGQGVQEVELAPLSVPGGQDRQPAAPIWLPMVPAGQTAHEAEPSWLNWPKEQVLQTGRSDFVLELARRAEGTGSRTGLGRERSRRTGVAGSAPDGRGEAARANRASNWTNPRRRRRSRPDTPCRIPSPPGTSFPPDKPGRGWLLPRSCGIPRGKEGSLGGFPGNRSRGAGLAGTRSADELVPAGQKLQTVPPRSGPNEPGLQGEQVADPFSRKGAQRAGFANLRALRGAGSGGTELEGVVPGTERPRATGRAPPSGRGIPHRNTWPRTPVHRETQIVRKGSRRARIETP
jgi:hypothetical protein